MYLLCLAAACFVDSRKLYVRRIPAWKAHSLELRGRMADISPHLALDGVGVQPSSAELTSTMLGYTPGGSSPSSAPMKSIVSNFYMTDPVSRASATMAKCVETFGPRV